MAVSKLSQVLVSSVILFLPISVVGTTFDCQIPQSCPPEKRFCTPVGCVSKCPDNSFENGSVCVLNCGDWVISNNSCREVCPPSKSIIAEKITVIRGSFQLVRRCVSVCRDFDQELIEHNGTCVRQCPLDFNLIVENSCTHKCPVMYPFLLEYDRYGNQVTECVPKCSEPLPFVDGVNRTCVSKCPENRKFVLNETCVANCTDSMPYFTNISGNLHCQTNCGTKLIQLQECVYQCDEDYFISDNACVKTCPSEKPYNETQLHYSEYKEVCVSNCSKFQLNGTCVSQCPNSHKFVLNETCHASCTDAMPYFTNVSGNLHCQTSCGIKLTQLQECVYICDKDYYVSDNTCVKACPAETPFMEFQLIRYRYRKVCVSNCSNFKLDGTFDCVSKCPDSHKFELNTTCHVNCTDAAPFFTKVSGNLLCQTSCDTRFIQLQECIDHCDDGYYISDNTCVKTCPSEKPFMEFQLITMHEDDQVRYSGYKEVCVSKCSGFQQNGTFSCVRTCPNKHKFVLNNTCVANCTKSMPYSIDVSGVFQCVNQCPSGTFAVDLTCMEKCPKVLYNGKCVSVCPLGTIRKNNVCYDPCTFGTRLNSTECHCGLHDADICVEKCPKHRSFNENSVCVEKCSDGKLGYDFICTKMATCNRSIIFNGQCLHSCPQGTYWSDSDIDTNESSSSCHPRSVLFLRFIACPFILLWIVLGIHFFRVKCMRNYCVYIRMRNCKDEPLVSETELHQCQPPRSEDHGTASSSV